MYGGAAEQCKSLVTLYFKAEKLDDKDTMSKSDPYLCLHQGGGGRTGGIGPKIGRTETIQNNLNPRWRQGITMDYYFERKQDLVVVVYDDDGSKQDSGNEKLLSVEFTLAQVMGSRGHILQKQSGKQILYIIAHEQSDSANDSINLCFFGRKLAKMDLFGLSDPYFIMYRLLPSGAKNKLYTSKHIDKTLDPKWTRCPSMKLSSLTGADMDAKCIEFECYDKDTFSDDMIGSFTCSVNQLIDSRENGSHMELTRKNKKVYGQILCSDATIVHQPTFPEYLSGGLEINLAVSVDFTGSNGDPKNPSSLHFMNPNHPNQYVRAIMSVGDILMQYDTDKQVPGFGFGARLPDGQVSHFFHLNLQPNPYLNGIQGVLDAYGQCITSVRLSGPTNFAPSIHSVCDGARKSANVYTVHLILTDGEITDMDRTIDAIVAADDAPLSIVIVGVGTGCDFQAMDQLDGDDGALMDGRGRKSRRDLVQFVPFTRFERSPPEALAAEVLREIPGQVVAWANLVGYKPPPPPQSTLTLAAHLR